MRCLAILAWVPRHICNGMAGRGGAALHQREDSIAGVLEGNVHIGEHPLGARQHLDQLVPRSHRRAEDRQALEEGRGDLIPPPMSSVLQEVAAPPFTDRVDEAQAIGDDPSQSPELDDADRALLGGALRDLRRAL